jgi:hypothetical protein
MIPNDGCLANLKPVEVLDSLTKEEYFALPDLSHSDSVLLLDNPKLYQWHVIEKRPRPKSAALDYGSLFDDLVLRDGPFLEHIAIVPPECLNKAGRVNSRGKAYIKWLADNGHRIIIKPNEKQALMMDSLKQNERAVSLLSCEGTCQLKIRWQCRSSGIWRRAMLDRYLPQQRIIIDLKTSRDSSPKSFARDAWNYHYASQAAWYQDAIEAMNDDGEILPVVFIVCQKEPPYTVRLYELSETFIDLGRQRNEHALYRYQSCKEAAKWEAPGEADIMTLDPPGYAQYDAQWELSNH